MNTVRNTIFSRSSSKEHEFEFLKIPHHRQESQNFSKIAHKLSKKISFGSKSVTANQKKMCDNNMKRKIDKLELPDSESHKRSDSPMSEYSSSEEEYGASATQPL